MNLMPVFGLFRAGKRGAQALVRRLAEATGIDRFSKPALFGLDDKLSEFLGYTGGFFVECGANDGFRQSNTYYLERFRGWTGVLIEPVPELYERCRKVRPQSMCIQSALVGPSHRGSHIEMTYAGLMSVVDGAFSNEQQAQDHIDRGLQIQRIAPHQVLAPASTLSALLDRLGIAREIDFLSLDVEGFEEEALRGIDLDRHAPRFVLVEARNLQAVSEILGFRYELAAQLTHHDYLFRRMGS